MKDVPHEIYSERRIIIAREKPIHSNYELVKFLANFNQYFKPVQMNQKHLPREMSQTNPRMLYGAVALDSIVDSCG